MDANWVDYQSGNLLTAGQLNDLRLGSFTSTKSFLIRLGS